MANAFNNAYTSEKIISQVNVKGTIYDIVDDAAKTVIGQLGTASKVDVATNGVAAGETGLVTGAQVAAALVGLNGAMHFVEGDRTSITSPKAGDVCIEGNKEYVYNGSAWIELGDESAYATKTAVQGIKIAGVTMGSDYEITKGELQQALEVSGDVVDSSTLGALAYKNSATGTVSGQTISGVKATGTSTGSISVDLTQTSTAASLSTADYTPAGEVVVTPATTTIQTIDGVGTQAALDLNVDENGVLSFTFTPNTLPTKNTAMTVATGITSAAFTGTKAENALVTAVNYDKATVNATNTKFTGAAITLNVGDITVAEKEVTVE